MKNTTWINTTWIALAASLTFAPLLRADNQIAVPWYRVCQAASGNELSVTTATGETVTGYCLSVDVDGMAIRTKDQRVVRVTRSTLSRIDMQVSSNEGHQLRSLGKNLHKGLHKEFQYLFSPYAPVGIVGIPATLAWAAISTPFCILGDLAHPPSAPQTKEIKIY